MPLHPFIFISHNTKNVTGRVNASRPEDDRLSQSQAIIIQDTFWANFCIWAPFLCISVVILSVLIAKELVRLYHRHMTKRKEAKMYRDFSVNGSDVEQMCLPEGWTSRTRRLSTRLPPTSRRRLPSCWPTKGKRTSMCCVPSSPKFEWEFGQLDDMMTQSGSDAEELRRLNLMDSPELTDKACHQPCRLEALVIREESGFPEAEESIEGSLVVYRVRHRLRRSVRGGSSSSQRRLRSVTSRPAGKKKSFRRNLTRTLSKMEKRETHLPTIREEMMCEVGPGSFRARKANLSRAKFPSTRSRLPRDKSINQSSKIKNMDVRVAKSADTELLDITVVSSELVIANRGDKSHGQLALLQGDLSKLRLSLAKVVDVTTAWAKLL